MEFIRLGGTGLRVSRICLGAMSYGASAWRPWVLDEDASRPFIRRALELGINYFDTADMYSRGKSEEVLGRALRDFARRDEVVIATKVFFPMSDAPNDRGLSRKHILQSIDASLARLGTDYVDLYQIHRYDPDTPWAETLEALDAVVRSGKALYVGASSMYAWQLMKALGMQECRGWHRFVSMQNHYNLVYREEEREMLPLCRAEGLGVVPWSPLARGFLAGNRKSIDSTATARAGSDDYARKLYDDALDLPVVDATVRVAGERGVPPAQVALAWLLQQPGVTAPIVGATKLQHLDDAVAAVELHLQEDEIRALEAPYRPHPVLGHR
jgi:aryl-alcohol dehydrogenase-like predicted oxidoreductase